MIGITYKSKYFLPKKSLLSRYCSLVYPYLHFCNLVWASTYKTNIHWIILLQKRIVRIIDNKDYRAPSDPSFKNLKILKVFKFNSFQTSITYVFSCSFIVTIYCLLPSKIFSHPVLLFMITILDLLRTFDSISLAQP